MMMMMVMATTARPFFPRYDTALPFFFLSFPFARFFVLFKEHTQRYIFHSLLHSTLLLFFNVLLQSLSPCSRDLGFFFGPFFLPLVDFRGFFKKLQISLTNAAVGARAI
jgi:hypothetical protein